MSIWSVSFLHGSLSRGSQLPSPCLSDPSALGLLGVRDPHLASTHTLAGPRAQAEKVSCAFFLTLATKRLEKMFPVLKAYLGKGNEDSQVTPLAHSLQ